MRRNAQEDLRIRKTLAAIDRAFCELMLEKEYGQISVTLLCQRAAVNKKTFYAHFRALDDVLRNKLELFSQGFMTRIQGFKLPDQLYDVHREFFLYSIEQGTLYEKLVCCAGYQHIGLGLLEGFTRKAWQSMPWFQQLPEDTRSMLLCFLYTTGAALYRQWVFDGKTMPVERAIELSGRLLCRGLYGVMAAYAGQTEHGAPSPAV